VRAQQADRHDTESSAIERDEIGGTTAAKVLGAFLAQQTSPSQVIDDAGDIASMNATASSQFRARKRLVLTN